MVSLIVRENEKSASEGTFTDEKSYYEKSFCKIC